MKSTGLFADPAFPLEGWRVLEIIDPERYWAPFFETLSALDLAAYEEEARKLMEQLQGSKRGVLCQACHRQYPRDIYLVEHRCWPERLVIGGKCANYLLTGNSEDHRWIQPLKRRPVGANLQRYDLTDDGNIVVVTNFSTYTLGPDSRGRSIQEQVEEKRAEQRAEAAMWAYFARQVASVALAISPDEYGPLLSEHVERQRQVEERRARAREERAADQKRQAEERAADQKRQAEERAAEQRRQREYAAKGAAIEATANRAFLDQFLTDQSIWTASSTSSYANSFWFRFTAWDGEERRITVYEKTDYDWHYVVNRPAERGSAKVYSRGHFEKFHEILQELQRNVSIDFAKLSDQEINRLADNVVEVIGKRRDRNWKWHSLPAA